MNVDKINNGIGMIQKLEEDIVKERTKCSVKSGIDSRSNTLAPQWTKTCRTNGTDVLPVAVSMGQRREPKRHTAIALQRYSKVV